MENKEKNNGVLFIYDLSNTYFGIYLTKDGYRSGLFKKTKKYQAKNFHEPLTAQYYEDLLSGNTVALWLDKKEKDIPCDFSQIQERNDEKENWKGVSSPIWVPFVKFHDLPKVTGVAEFLVETSSVFPELTHNINSLQDIINKTREYSSKFELFDNAKKEIEEGIKEIPSYFESKGIISPVFDVDYELFNPLENPSVRINNKEIEDFKIRINKLSKEKLEVFKDYVTELRDGMKNNHASKTGITTEIKFNLQNYKTLVRELKNTPSKEIK